MGFAQDLQDQIQRSGRLANGLSVYEQQRARAAIANRTVSALDPVIDIQWEEAYGEKRAIHSYFDYYFTGQDIQVYIDGIDKPDPDADMPILNLGFTVTQNKQPVYGFWSYTYDAVMRGTRLVNGVLQIATTSTDYMARMLSKAAKNRSKSNYLMRGLDTDEQNVQKYWGRNINDDAAYSNGKHIFSAHPPFNLVIIYGIQSSSITENAGDRFREVIERYRTDGTPLMTDTNERLVSTEQDNAMRIVLENCEITRMESQYSPDGMVCYETYTFFARDIITPKLGTNRPRRNPSPPGAVGGL